MRQYPWMKEGYARTHPKNLVKLNEHIPFFFFQTAVLQTSCFWLLVVLSHRKQTVKGRTELECAFDCTRDRVPPGVDRTDRHLEGYLGLDAVYTEVLPYRWRVEDPLGQGLKLFITGKRHFRSGEEPGLHTL